MSTPEHTALSVLIENLAAIVTGVTILLLALLGYLGKRDSAKLAKAVITETPVSHTELLECRMQVESAMRAAIKGEFTALKTDFLAEIRLLHKSNHQHLKDYHRRKED